LVFAKPADWIIAVLVWVVLNTILNLFPLLSLLAGLLTPVFMGGIMLGAHDQERGGKFGVGHVFAGFTGDKLGPLVLVGALYMAGLVAIGLVVVLLMETGGLIPTGGVSGLDSGLAVELAAGRGALLPLLLTVSVGLVMVPSPCFSVWLSSYRPSSLRFTPATATYSVAERDTREL
jgi:hypothetical protein